MVSMTSFNAVFDIQQTRFWISTLFYISGNISNSNGISSKLIFVMWNKVIEILIEMLISLHNQLPDTIWGLHLKG